MKHSKTEKYTCILFDLDHTLWDYDTNSAETLCDLYRHHNLGALGVPSPDDFVNEFKSVNLRLWDLFDRGQIDSAFLREERFKQILTAFNAYDYSLSERLTEEYLTHCPRKCNLMPMAIETLEYLAGRYSLAIITNGFEEIQHMKLTAGNLHQYFDHIITSQKAGCRKPAKEIFEYALQLNNARCNQALMIGDNPITDIGGAQNASIDTVLFNPLKLKFDVQVNYEIHGLDELQQIL